jgi:Fe-S cluster assembly protein SufD
MAGLLNSSSDALAQWRRLFETRGGEYQSEAGQHMQQLLQLGLPGRKHENWKYTFTSLEKLLAHRFVMPPSALPLKAAQRDALALEVDALRLVFVDGHFAPTLSDSPDGSGFSVEINHKRQALAPPVQSEIFLQLTESLSHSVTHIRLARNTRACRPLLLMHIASGSMGEEMKTAHYRHHFELEQGAQATVIEHYVSLDNATHFTGARLTVSVGANATLNHYKLAFENAACYHFAHNDLRVAQDATAHSSSYLLGAGVLRHNTSTRLNGENATLRINSLSLPVDGEVCDSRTWLEHNKGYCNSRQLHKAIVRDRARAVFNGLITVAQRAIKTDGQMTNNNLLIGRLAEVDTKPQLEIYADDVKCSHGATVGRIDDEQMFYLRSRGIGQDAAQRMIIFAFAAELTDAICDESLKQQVLARIGRRFAGGEA